MRAVRFYQYGGPDVLRMEEVAIPSGKTIRFKPGKELQAHEDGETVVDDSNHDDEDEDF